MKILIATPIFPPEIGGPALYSQKLAEEFLSRGLEVGVITYGKSGVFRWWPSGVRQLIYFFKLFRQAKNSDAIFAFDSLGAGLPAVLAGKILRKKVVIRLGGDFLWEKFVETGKEMVTLSEFYEQKKYKEFPLLHRLIIFTLRNSIVAFTTEFQKNLFVEHYNLDPQRTLVISNTFDKKKGETIDYRDNSRIILWAGRFLKLKNLDFLLKVFKRLLAYDKNLILEMAGEGPELEKLKVESRKLKVNNKVLFLGNLDQSEISEKIRESYFCILPSLSEVSPNFALRCLSLSKPIILTEETGIKEQFPGLFYADPQKEDSFFAAALRLLDANTYDNYQKFISDIRYQKTWKNLAEEYLQLLK